MVDYGIPLPVDEDRRALQHAAEVPVLGAHRTADVWEIVGTNKGGLSNMIDYMKKAKMLYLADVLEDIAKEMEKNFHNKPFCKSINDIVKDLRDTLAPTAPTAMQEERIQIKRIERRRALTEVFYMPTDEIPRFEEYAREAIVSDLLHYIRQENLIRVRKDKNEQGYPVFTASLIVGIEQEPDIPIMEEPVTFLDSLAKYLDETRE